MPFSVRFCCFSSSILHSTTQLSDFQIGKTCNVILNVAPCLSPLLFVLAGTQSQLNLERSKSRIGTFVEGGPMAETNPDEGYETNIVSCELCSYAINVE